MKGYALFQALKQRRVVCIGESHDNPYHHYVQWRVVTLLASHAKSAGERMAVGFEMFQQQAQPVMDAYAAQKIDEAELLQQSEYPNRWGFDYAFYRPILASARRSDAQLLALNAPREWTKAIARTDLAKLSPELKKQLPELKLDDGDHRSFFTTAMGGHPGQHGNLERFYAAQVTWDETMAHNASQWLRSSDTPSRLVIIAGSGHCHRSAIPRRIERRIGEKVLSVRPVFGHELGKSPAPRDSEFDLLLVIAEE